MGRGPPQTESPSAAGLIRALMERTKDRKKNYVLGRGLRKHSWSSHPKKTPACLLASGRDGHPCSPHHCDR